MKAQARLKLHLLILPRHFADLSALCGMLLGVALAGHWTPAVLFLLASGLCLAWFAHTANSWLDYSWTGLDQGPEPLRSREKVYTGGQGVIAQGLISPREVALGAFGWLSLSAALIAVASVLLSPWVWLPWLLMAPLTFWYSWAKLHFHPEIPLCLGFAVFAPWLGMAAFGRPDFWLGFLGSLPLFLIWTTAEQVDQALDYAPNWPKGARSSGMWWRHRGLSLGSLVALMVSLTVLAQGFLVSAGILSPWALLSLIGVLPLWVCIRQVDTREKVGVMWGLAGVTLFQSLLVLGQALG